MQRATRQSNTAADTDIVPGTALGALCIRAEVASVYMRACGAIEAMSDSTVDLAIGRLQIIFNDRRLLGMHALAILFPFLAKSEGRRPLLRAMLTYRALEVSRHGVWLVEDDVSLFATANNLDVCLTHAVEVAPPDHLADNSVSWVSPESRFLNRTFLLPDGTDNVLAEPATWAADIDLYVSLLRVPSFPASLSLVMDSTHYEPEVTQRSLSGAAVPCDAACADLPAATLVRMIESRLPQPLPLRRAHLEPSSELPRKTSMRCCPSLATHVLLPRRLPPSLLFRRTPSDPSPLLRVFPCRHAALGLCMTPKLYSPPTSNLWLIWQSLSALPRAARSPASSITSR